MALFTSDDRQVVDGYNRNGTGIDVATALSGMAIDSVRHGCVVFQLRPLTDEAVQNLLDAEKNNTLVKMVCEILKQVKMPEMMFGSKPMEIKVRVCYACSSKEGESPIQLKK